MSEEDNRKRDESWGRRSGSKIAGLSRVRGVVSDLVGV